jgi:multimeric flavodoxin WrbA
MKKIIAFNGSPRKNCNTAMLLEKALEGAASIGAETKLINLYDLEHKGCVSCFACKTKNGKSYGRCAINDELTAILTEIEQADALVFGSPLYFGTMTGKIKLFFERLLFPYSTYTNPPKSLFPKKIPTAFIYTMNVDENSMYERQYDKQIALNEMFLTSVFGSTETLCSFDTYQFEDYSKVFAPRFDAEIKLKNRQEVFPTDCQKAFEMGVRLVS